MLTHHLAVQRLSESLKPDAAIAARYLYNQALIALELRIIKLEAQTKQIELPLHLPQL